MRRPKPDITKYDFTFPCAHCGYKIPPSELLHIDGEHIKCPKCGQDSVYGQSGQKLGGNVTPRNFSVSVMDLLIYPDVAPNA